MGYCHPATLSTKSGGESSLAIGVNLAKADAELCTSYFFSNEALNRHIRECDGK